jgi:hypothetical protein
MDPYESCSFIGRPYLDPNRFQTEMYLDTIDVEVIPFPEKKEDGQLIREMSEEKSDRQDG